MNPNRNLVNEGWSVAGPYPTVLTNDNNVYQDGGLAICRDGDGMLWGLFGHENLGGVSLWNGSSMNNIAKVCNVSFNFKMGRAGEAFGGTVYPDGPLSRGLIWPCGLWIDGENGRFYCFVHNETGWGALDTSYTAFAQQEGEPDFRHIGLMTSDDRGQSWDFTGWIITSNTPCWTNLWRPESMTGGQDGDDICLGAGDFTLYVNHRDGFLYIFYTQITHNVLNNTYTDAIFAARAPFASRGLPGSWRKLYNGNFSEPGNMGRETPVITGGNVPCISYNTHIQKYIMSSYNRECWRKGLGACQLATSTDLVSWSQPVLLDPSNAALSNPYFTICNADCCGKHNETGNTFSIFMESNGTDVQRMDITIE